MTPQQELIAAMQEYIGLISEDLDYLGAWDSRKDWKYATLRNKIAEGLLQQPEKSYTKSEVEELLKEQRERCADAYRQTSESFPSITRAIRNVVLPI